MHIIEPHIERIIFADREAQIAAQPVTLLVIAAGIGIGCVVAVVENFPAKANAINGIPEGIGDAQLDIGLVAAARAVETDAVARTQPVVLSDAQLIANAAVGAITNTEVKGAGVAFLHLIHHIDSVRDAGNRHRLGVDGFQKKPVRSRRSFPCCTLSSFSHDPSI